MSDAAALVPWQDAWQRALYGPTGFYLRAEGPAGHFRTACHAGAGVLAGALTRLALETGCTGIVDVGAGRGELLRALAAHRLVEAELGDPPSGAGGTSGAGGVGGPDGPTDGEQDEADAADPGDAGTAPGAADLTLHGVDLVDRPTDLPAGVGWSRGLDALPDEVLDGALVVAWELLDVVPGPIAEVDRDGTARIVLVDPRTGTESSGPPLNAVENAWCARWWPLMDTEPGDRVEIGLARDQLWHGLVKRVARTQHGGVLLAVDYGHDVEHRPGEGTLSAYHGGRLVPPVPDGSCDLTTHVALDAVAAAGERAGATQTLTLRQREALRALGVAITPGDLAAARAAGMSALLAQLELRSEMDELLDVSGLGGFGWLVQGVRHRLPPALEEAGHHRPY